MRDWNNDGKIDGRDLAFDYMIFKSMSSDQASNQSESQDVSGCASVLLALIIMIFTLIMIGLFI